LWDFFFSSGGFISLHTPTKLDEIGLKERKEEKKGNFAATA
jgi:hypothetical protein